jgi:hypothetical protein
MNMFKVSKAGTGKAGSAQLGWPMGHHAVGAELRPPRKELGASERVSLCSGKSTTRPHWDEPGSLFPFPEQTQPGACGREPPGCDKATVAWFLCSSSRRQLQGSGQAGPS